MQQNRSSHKFAAKKLEVGKEIIDHGQLSDELEHLWEELLDKGYQGIQEILRGVHPRKKPLGSNLTQADISFN